MNPQDYPEYHRYTDLLAQRDDGLLLCVLAAGIAVVYLVAFRAYWPRWLPLMRRVLTIAYFVSLAFFIVWRLAK